MSRCWKDLRPSLCKEVEMTIAQLEFETMTPVQVNIFIFIFASIN